MTFTRRVFERGAPVFAAGAFLVVLATFLTALFGYRTSVLERASVDLNSRAYLAASSLEGPVRTMDFRAIREVSSSIAAEGFRLRVTGGATFLPPETGKKSFFDSNGTDGDDSYLWGSARCGEYHIGVGRLRREVLRSFRRVLFVVLLAGVMGVLAMGVVFFTLYRQRVRISELAKLEQFRREFIADVSHEVKTPLTGLLGAADLLKGVPFEQKSYETFSKLVAMIGSEAGRLQMLMQQILDLARLERTDEALVREKADLSVLSREVSLRRGVNWKGPSEAVCLDVDARLLEQALENLIGNALRHSGSMDVAVALEKGESEIRLTVEDHGCGIPSEHVERIFERFYRVDPARASVSGGAGLGLPIVRRIARLHGGDVVYAPAHPHGACFTLVLPR